MTALPGLTPRSPVMMDAPVLVTVEPPRTAKRRRHAQWRGRLGERRRSAEEKHRHSHARQAPQKL